MSQRSTALLIVASIATCQTLANEGFTEPYRTIHVAAPETGIIGQTLVEEGSVVQKGAPLVQLDVDLQQSLLAIAEVGKDARGRVISSQAEVSLRQHMLAALEELRANGHSRPEELERARADLAIAEGQLTAAREQQVLKELEYKRIRVQIERRTVRAPLDGVVTKVLKHAGEFTAPNDPNLVVLVQLDPLYATFDLVSSDAAGVSVRDTVEVKFTESGKRAEAIVEYVSPVIDAESGTIAVKVRVPNPSGELQSGQACSLTTH
ncbi:MAG: efflux RND transporter periplasmic adaptor subunit [Aeoliella sp.]